MADKTTITKEAQKYMLKGQIDKAIAEWEKLIRESPDGNTYNVIGDLYLRKGDKKNAVDYLHRSANFFRQEGFSLKALALYKKVLNINQTDSDALYALGQLSEEKGLATDSIKYYLATADSLSKEGAKEKLIAVYQKILALSPANMQLRVKVAEIFLKEGLIPEGIAEYIAIAKSLEEKADYQKAREFYQKVIELQPANKDAAVGMVELLEKSGSIEEALTHLKALKVLFPDDTAIMLKAAELNMLAGHTAEAETYLLKLRNADPTDVNIRKLLGDLYLKTKKEEKAFEEYIPVIEQMTAEENFDGALHLLELFREVSPLDVGKRTVTLLKHLHDDERLFAELVSLGELSIDQGLEEEAKNCYREASEIKPYDEDIKLRLKAFEVLPEPPAPEKEKEKDTIAIVSSEKTADEIFVETDIFSRYGLLNEAIKLLEGLKGRDPQNMEVHLRLKALYGETGDMESAVTECLILHELYKRSGDADNAAGALRDAAEIAPNDPRLEGKVATPAAFEPTSYDSFGPETAQSETDTGIEDYEDSLAEADFYIRQGLNQEATKILEKMHALFPDNSDIIERLESMGQISEPFETTGLDTEFDQSLKEDITGDESEFHLEHTSYGHAAAEPEPDIPLAGPQFSGFEKDAFMSGSDHEETPEKSADTVAAFGAPSEETAEEDGFDMPHGFEMPAAASGFTDSMDELEGEVEIPTVELPEETTTGELPEPPITAEDIHAVNGTFSDIKTPGVDEGTPQAGKESTGSEYEDLILTDQDLVDAEEMPDLALDNDVLEIFQEFKKGLEKELGDEDSETHYNLGIAYKEMGLVDDAIKEFQSSRNDPNRFVQSSTMLGVCYIEKGLYSLAVEALNKVSKELTEQDESYWPVKYDLADAYEKNNNLKDALALYTAVYGWNAKFRGVAEKMAQLQARVSKGEGTKTGSGEKPREKKDRVSYL